MFYASVPSVLCSMLGELPMCLAALETTVKHRIGLKGFPSAGLIDTSMQEPTILSELLPPTG